MNFLNSKEFYRFIIAYSQFFNYDIYFSLIEGRDFTIIDLFRKILASIFNLKIKRDNIEKAIRKIEKELKRRKKSKINIQFTITTQNLLSKPFSLKELEFYFIEFFYAYEKLINYLDKKEKINNILIEFNNALSHILFALEYHDTFKSNINKAKSHLYRAILDCYKEILLENNNFIKNNENLYITIRKQEALNIGKNEDIKKEIIKKYKKLLTKSFKN